MFRFFDAMLVMAILLITAILLGFIFWHLQLRRDIRRLEEAVFQREEPADKAGS